MAKKKQQPAGGSTPALALLERTGTAHTVHTYEHDPASTLGYGEEAAHALGISASQLFKTLLASVEGRLVVGIVPVDRQLDLKALAQAVGGKKAAMADPAVAERATGYVVGGISPLGQRQQHPTVLDVSALAHESVYVSGGRRGLDVGLAPTDLIALTGATTAEVARA